MKNRVCIECGDHFIPKSHSQNFCTEYCKNIADVKKANETWMKKKKRKGNPYWGKGAVNEYRGQ